MTNWTVPRTTTTGTGTGTGTAWQRPTAGQTTSPASSWGAGTTAARSPFTGTRTPQYRVLFKPDPVFSRLWRLQAAYNPESDAYRFTYVFYNKKTSPTPPQRPKFIPEDQWIEIWTNCPDPDNLCPWPVQGFEALQERHEAQKVMLKELKSRMRLLQAKLREMSLFYTTELRGYFDKIRQNRTKVNQEVLTVVEVEEMARTHGMKMASEEFELLAQLEGLNSEVERPGRFGDILEQLKQRIEMEKEERRLPFTLTPETRAAMTRVAQMNQEAVEALETQIKRMRKLVREWESERADG
jgi:hypothetical protein